MSLLSTASPYHSREDGNETKNNKKPNTRRKATLPSKSSSITEAKQYMSQLMQNKEPQPSSYSDELHSYQSSGISDMLYPTLEDTSSQNIQHHENEPIKAGESLGEELLRKNNALPEMAEMPSFYKKNKTQQNSMTSALQKLTGNKSITQEGMMDHSSMEKEEEETLSSTLTKHGNQSMENSGAYIPTMPAVFTMNQMNNDSNTHSPIDYLKSPSSSATMFSDYSSSYSSENYVVPPNLSQYSYPIMRRPSSNYSSNIGNIQRDLNEESNTDRTQQLLLEKINYMIYLMEQQKKEKSKHTTEEFVLYSFLGVFVIYLADSFARSGRYIR